MSKQHKPAAASHEEPASAALDAATAYSYADLLAAKGAGRTVACAQIAAKIDAPDSAVMTVGSFKQIIRDVSAMKD